ncbi:MAG: DUF2127 domain-containing protein [Casimicrobiaceae bacterium]
MKLRIPETTIRLWFRVSLIFKAALSALEIMGGILALLVSQAFLLDIVTMITQDEILEDPQDLIAGYLLKSVNHLSIGSQRFVALYLLIHGLIKGYLIVGLLRERLWYYPTAMIAFTVFVAYQLYRYQFTHSLWLLMITVVDVLVILLTWHEFQYLRRRVKVPRQTRPQ